MKFSKELIPIILALAALVAVNVFYNRNGTSRPSQMPHVEYTSYSAEERGTKALYLLLEELGYEPERLRASYHLGMRSEGLAVVMVPNEPVDETDTEQLLEWVRQGNTLLFVPGRRRTPLLNSLKLRLRQRLPREKSIAPFQATHLTDGIQELSVQSGNRIRTARQDVVVRHFRDKAGVVVLSLLEGEGTVIVLSDPYLMTNAGLSEGDNLNLLVNILLTYAEDTKTVYIDEYHHGFERKPTVLHLLKGTSFGWALVQVALAVILLMYSRARRFGRPKPVFREAHRSSMEYVTSLAGIYRTAQAADIALWNLYEQRLRSVRRPDENIRELMALCESKMKDQKLTEKELLELSRRITLAQRPGEGE